MKRELAVVSVLAIMLISSGCTPGASEPEEAPGKQEVVLPSEEEVTAFLDVDCADIINAGVVKVLNDGGWAVEATSPWKIGDTSLANGLLCEWSAGEGEPMSYGWAEAEPAEATSISGWLEESGWSVEALEGESVHTAPDSTATYIIGDGGEIRYSSTPEGARAVQRPA